MKINSTRITSFISITSITSINSIISVISINSITPNKVIQALLLLFFLYFSQSPARQQPGFYVDGRFLYDRFGEKTILRGANAMIVFWDRYGAINYPELAKTGANCCRIFWRTGHAPEPVMPAIDLDITIQNCFNNRMIPIPSVWDATGDWDKLQDCVDYWTRADVAAVLQKHERYLILNIANEPGSRDMGQTEFREEYTKAIQRIREAGIHVPLIIDADRWGRNGDSLLDNGQYLFEQDPDRNVLFSWHLWDPRHYGQGSKTSIRRIIDGSIEKDICLIVGEFGPCEQCDRCNETPIEWSYLIQYCHENQIGWMAWVWRWTDCHSLIGYEPGIYGDWTNPPWGNTIAFDSPYSIEQTSVRPRAVDPQSSVSDAPPGNYILDQNYPNPFNTFTNIGFELYAVSEVILEVFDIEGRKIRTLVRGKRDEGPHTARWDGLDDSYRRVSSGMYLCRLQVENGDRRVIETIKILHIK